MKRIPPILRLFYDLAAWFGQLAEYIAWLFGYERCSKCRRLVPPTQEIHKVFSFIRKDVAYCDKCIKEVMENDRY